MPSRRRVILPVSVRRTANLASRGVATGRRSRPGSTHHQIDRIDELRFDLGEQFLIRELCR